MRVLPELSAGINSIEQTASRIHRKMTRRHEPGRLQFIKKTCARITRGIGGLVVTAVNRSQMSEATSAIPRDVGNVESKVRVWNCMEC